MARFILFSRAHLIAFASYGFLVAVALSALPAVTADWFLGTIAVLVVMAVCGSFDEWQRMKQGNARGELEKFGTVIGFCAYPRPGTSLLKALDKFANVQPEDIEEVKMQTCGFSNPYLKDLSRYFAENGVHRDVPIEVMGTGDTSELSDVASVFPHLTVSNSRKKLSTHFNLVKAKGQYYLWFEPEHKDDVPNYIPSQGAFLVTVQDTKAALARFDQDRSPDHFLATSY